MGVVVVVVGGGGGNYRSHCSVSSKINSGRIRITLPL